MCKYLNIKPLDRQPEIIPTLLEIEQLLFKKITLLWVKTPL